jgi:hypothetical protein
VRDSSIPLPYTSGLPTIVKIVLFVLPEEPIHLSDFVHHEEASPYHIGPGGRSCLRFR